MEERWKPIEKFPWYEVSDQGRVRSIDRQRKKIKNGIVYSAFYKSKVLTPVPNSQGYLRVWLRNESNKRNIFIHRLVAEAFCDNPSGCNEVNHKDFDFLNNRASNLEWTTHCENMRHSFKAGRFERTPRWIENLNRGLDKMRLPVIGTCVETGNIIEFSGVNSVKEFGFQPSCVCNCCKGIRETHKGYSWRYAG